MEPDHSQTDVLELYVTPGPPGDGALLIRMSPQIADEVRMLLDEHGLDHSRGAEFSSGPELAIESVKVLGATGGLAALASVINTMIKRHDSKRIVIERDKFEAAGFSEKAVERMLQKQAEGQAKHEGEWERISGRAQAEPPSEGT